MRNRFLMWLRLCALILIPGLVGCQQQQEPPSAQPPPQAQAQPQTPPSATADSSGAQSLTSVDLQIGKATLHTQVAATPDEQERGLMFYTKLGDNDGMIFLLPLGRASFWMKNTLIPLSVAFIDKDGVILEIHDMAPAPPNLPDNQIPQTNSESANVAFALETNLHWFALNGIKPGDKIDPPPATLAKKAAHDKAPY